ncbi:hypothetical protein AEAC466_13480 [Asticcacaulis sp. AC466]|uniref:hypothetical protein n=1 Tax=Asticcacaulis sp. AC466 TaxID=1282362 RepID=UPI0003C3EE1E|nr:hypothetical protein [Asticcacaulis sp. AC466]ESQ83258.1 hypothetical protein AEAC466_13480 [Asticcacaulis sp. AC466]
MSVTLPSWPSPQQFTPRLIGYGNDLTPPLGGDIQRIVRLGDRWAVEVTLAPQYREDAEIWLSRLAQGTRDSVIYDWPQREGGVGTPGTPVVNGAGQSGNSLSLDGLTPGYVIGEGQFFSVIVSGRRYLHMATAAVTVNGAGQAVVPILPLLRVTPPDNAVVEIAQPKIEGLIQKDDVTLPMGATGIIILKFSITEQK